MPLSTFRRHQDWMLWVLIVLACIVFGVFGTGFAISDWFLRSKAGIYGFYRGRPIYKENYMLFRTRWGRLYSRTGRDQDELDRYLFGQMIRLQEAQRAGVQVTDAEVVDQIRMVISGGRDRNTSTVPTFNHDAYRALLKRLGLSKVSFEQTMREQLMVEKYERALMNVIRTGEQETRIGFEQQNSRVKVRFVSLRANDFSELSDPASEDVRIFFEDNAKATVTDEESGRVTTGRYYQPDRVAIEYAWASFKNYEPKVKVTRAEVEDFYKKNQGRFKNPPEEVKKGKPEQKSLEEAFGEIEKELRQSKARQMARSAILQISRGWLEIVPSEESANHDGLLEKLARKNEVNYRGKTRPFSTRELNKAGRISRAKKFLENAFRVFPDITTMRPWQADQAKTNLSDIMDGQDAFYVLRILSKKSKYEPTWTELVNGELEDVDLSTKTVKEDLKVKLGFERAEAKGDEIRVAIYGQALQSLAQSLKLQVQELDISKMGDFPSLGPAESTVVDKAFTTDVGDITAPFQVEDKTFILLVQSEKDEKRAISYLAVPHKQFESFEYQPSLFQLKFYYQQVKSRSKYQQPGKVSLEYVLSPYKSSDAKKTVVSKEEALAKLEELSKSLLKKKDDKAPSPAEENLRDQIRDAAKAKGLVYKKNLEAFSPADQAAREKVLGRAIANAADTASLLKELKDKEWSKIYRSADGPFTLRIVKRGDPTPADFDDVLVLIEKDLGSLFGQEKPTEKLSLLWEQAMHGALDKVAELPPIAVKSRRRFSADEATVATRNDLTTYFAEDAAALAPVLKVKTGQVSPVMKGQAACYLAAVLSDDTDEDQRSLKLLTTTFGREAFKSPGLKASPEEVQSRYQAKRSAYRTPDQVQLEYLYASFGKLADSKAAKAKATDAAIKTYYEANKDPFWKNSSKSTAKKTVYYPLAEVKSEVSFALRSAAAEKMAAELIAKALTRLKALKTAKAGQVEKVAGQLGLRHGTTEFFSKEFPENAASVLKDLQHLPEITGTAFALKNNQWKSGNDLKAPDGIAIIRRKAFKKSRIPPLAEIRSQVQGDIINAKALELARAHAETVRAKMVEAIKNADKATARRAAFRSVIAEADYLADTYVYPKVAETDFFSWPDFSPERNLPNYGSPYALFVPGLDRPNSAEFGLAAFALPRGRISRPVSERNDKSECFILALSGQTFPSEKEYEQRKTQFLWLSRYLKQREATQSWARQLTLLQQQPSS